MSREGINIDATETISQLQKTDRGTIKADAPNSTVNKSQERTYICTLGWKCDR